MTRLLAAALFGVTLSLAAVGHAETVERSLVIKDHKFTPAEIEVPVGEKIRLTVSNEDSSAEEFESHELNREKVIAGNSKAVIFIGPLEAGRYPFFGEFNPKTAQGVIVAK